MPAQIPSGTTPVAPDRWRLRRELIWALALKLVVLLAIKAAFFAHRVPADTAAQGVAERFASDATASGKSVSKDQP